MLKVQMSGKVFGNVREQSARLHIFNRTFDILAAEFPSIVLEKLDQLLLIIPSESHTNYECQITINGGEALKPSDKQQRIGIKVGDKLKLLDPAHDIDLDIEVN